MLLRGVVIRSTIRGGHASLATAVSNGDNSDEKIVLVVIRFGGSEWNENESPVNKSYNEKDVRSNEISSERQKTDVSRMRSNIRRLSKIGNELDFVGSFEKQTSASDAVHSNQSFNDWDKFLVDYYIPTIDCDECENVRLVQAQKLDAKRCQTLQSKYFPTCTHKQQQQQQNQQQPKVKRSCTTTESFCIHHKSGLGKRQQGEVVADFLLFVISTMHNEYIHNSSSNSIEEQTTTKQFENYEFRKRIVNCDLSSSILNNTNSINKIDQVPKLLREKRVLDVAGGAGHVSLALTLRNVKSTVIDPRSTVGSLPGRDRKLLKKSKKPMFDTYRAWFGSRPDGVDTFFREGCKDYFASSGPQSLEAIFQHEMIPVCSYNSDDKLLPNCAAIVALHPDEATGVIVETAVKYRIPFVVVPCCVFSRLFSNRMTMGGQVVSTYHELIDWLVAKHPDIKVTRLPFSGANLALWATFVK